jgi:hypothetical protein
MGQGIPVKGHIVPFCVMREKCTLFALVISLWMPWVADANEAQVSLDALTSVLRYNESSLLSYQGKVSENEYVTVETNRERQFVKPLAEPLLMRTTDTEFVHDVTRGEDYRVTMRQHSDQFTIRNSVTTERRNGSYLETLGQTGAGEPRIGIISTLKEAYYLGHSPRSLDAATHLYILTSEAEQGFYRLPLSQCMAESQYVWPCGTEDVEGYRCQKYAVQVVAPSGKQAYMTYVWLGQDVNFNIVKQETVLVPPDSRKPFSELAAHDDLPKLLDSIESSKPAMLMVNRNYIKTESGIWVPQTAVSYVLGSLNPSKLRDPNDSNALLAANSRDPHTKHLRTCVAKGFHVWTLDMKSLRLNEPIDPNVFEKSIIPAGTPVSNFRLGIHPRDIERVAQESLEKVMAAVEQQPVDANAEVRDSTGPQTNDRRPSNFGPGMTVSARPELAEGASKVTLWLPVLLSASAFLVVGVWLARKVRRNHVHSGKEA